MGFNGTDWRFGRENEGKKCCYFCIEIWVNQTLAKGLEGVSYVGYCDC